MSVAIHIKLDRVLAEADITKNALAREAKVRPNLIYDMCEGKTKRMDLDTLSVIIDTLKAMTGRKYTVSDILEHVEGDRNDNA